MPDSRPRIRPRSLARETIRLAFVAALQHLPPRQRAVPDPLRGAALAGDRGRRAARDERRLGEQRAPARAGDARGERRLAPTPAPSLESADAELLARYVDAFERYDMEALTSLIHEDATQSMPPFDLWLRGRDDIFTWWFGPGIGCAGLARDPDRVGERLARVRPVQAERDGRRLRAVGAAGARDRRTAGSSSSRSSSTPRRSSRSSGCRSSSTRSDAQPAARRAGP